MTDPDTRVPRIALLVDTATGWGRRLILGVHRYAHKYGPWRIWVEPRGQHESLRLPPGWTGDGVIARVSTPQMAVHLAEAGIPAVNVSGIKLSGSELPTVTVNPAASAKLALEHFIDRGFRQFAYCGPRALPYVEEHRHAFEDVVASVGSHCHIHQPRQHRGASSYDQQLSDMADWIAALPKPVAVFTWGATSRGHLVLDACHQRGIDIPHEVAVLCGDDDDLLSELAYPPVSGILVPSEQIGFEAAQMLDALLRGEGAAAKPVLLDPHGIETRQSTDTLSIDDSEVAMAVRFIRENSTSPIQVVDVLRHVPVSRRSLERRFARVLGRSPSEEIRRVRLAKAVQLLVNTDLPMPEVAARSGFGTPQYLARIFNRQYEMSPMRYRQRAQGR